MPRLLYINEKFGYDATIVLDSGEACWISVGTRGVLVRSHKRSFWGGLLGSLFDRKLYSSATLTKHFKSLKPQSKISIGFEN